MRIFSVEPALQDQRGKEAKLYPFFNEQTAPSPKIQSGYIIFPAGSRVPQEGFTFHAGHEFSYVISGSLEVCSGGRVHTIREGDCSFIPAREEHYSQNLTGSDCVLKYILVED